MGWRPTTTSVEVDTESNAAMCPLTYPPRPVQIPSPNSVRAHTEACPGFASSRDRPDGTDPVDRERADLLAAVVVGREPPRLDADGVHDPLQGRPVVVDVADPDAPAGVQGLAQAGERRGGRGRVRGAHPRLGTVRRGSVPGADRGDRGGH